MSPCFHFSLWFFFALGWLASPGVGSRETLQVTVEEEV